MNIFALLALIFTIPLIFFLAYLILSTCLGDAVRARTAGVPLSVRFATYGRTYGRNMGYMAQGGWEQMEMQEMVATTVDEHEDERHVRGGLVREGGIELRGNG